MTLMTVDQGDANNPSPIQLAPNTFYRLTFTGIPVTLPLAVLDAIRTALRAMGLTVPAIWQDGGGLHVDLWTPG